MALTREDWLALGMKTLAAEGFGALKADLLAKALDVSRGSFYWHFRDLSEFHEALLDAWHSRATQQVIDWLEQTANAEDRLRRLLRRAWAADNATERAIRAWAAHNPDVARRVEAIDRQRVDYIAGQLRSLGVSRRQARARALFMACAYLGRAVLGDGAFASIAAKDLDAIVKQLQA